MAIHITRNPTLHITLHITLHVHSHITLHVTNSTHPATQPSTSLSTQPSTQPTNLLALRHSILADHVAAVSQAHCIVNLERMVERSLEAVQILVLRLAPLNLAER